MKPVKSVWAQMKNLHPGKPVAEDAKHLLGRGIVVQGLSLGLIGFRV